MSSKKSALLDALVSEILPAGTKSTAQSQLRDETNSDYLGLLIEQLRRVETKQTAQVLRSQSAPPRFWLEAQHAQGATLTMGVSGYADQQFTSWLGPRLVWWPHGQPQGRRVGIVSSRLGRNLDEQSDWFSSLRAVCAELNTQSELLLTAKSTTTARFLFRCSALFGLRILEVNVEENEHATLETWLAQIRKQERAHDALFDFGQAAFV